MKNNFYISADEGGVANNYSLNKMDILAIITGIGIIETICLIIGKELGLTLLQSLLIPVILGIILPIIAGLMILAVVLLLYIFKIDF